jgi:hypothetical protein
MFLLQNFLLYNLRKFLGQELAPVCSTLDRLQLYCSEAELLLTGL